MSDSSENDAAAYHMRQVISLPHMKLLMDEDQDDRDRKYM